MRLKLFFLCLLTALCPSTLWADDMQSTPLTFEAVEAGTISVTWSEWSTPSLNVIQYKLESDVE